MKWDLSALTGRPTRDWMLYRTDDLGSLSGVCALCGTQIRYIHLVYHPDYNRRVYPDVCVGAVCCAHLMLPEALLKANVAETALRKRAARLQTWMKPESWTESVKRNGKRLWKRRHPRALVHETDYGFFWVIPGPGGETKGSAPTTRAAGLAAFEALNGPAVLTHAPSD